MGSAKALVIPAVGPALDPELFRGSALRLFTGHRGRPRPRRTRTFCARRAARWQMCRAGRMPQLAEYVIANALALKRAFFAASAPLRAGHYAEHGAAMVKASPAGSAV